MGKFAFSKTRIKDVYIVEPAVFGDDRGFFMETYHEKIFFEAGIAARFVQDNQSQSRRGVLRGLHFQKEKQQAKLVRAISGEIFDVAVDLRKNSATYGRWVGLVLSAENKKQLFIPRGFAHGFLVLSETAEFVYKCDEFYYPGDEGGLMWNDSAIGIEWPAVLGADIILSDKDQTYAPLSEQKIVL